MLEIRNISKIYESDELELKALDDVSVNLRRNEFVSILGPSGSGKTTLLNIIGGLDHYTSGDLVIEGVSTKDYTDRDWDAYRNSRVGFVFQSYNLIGHQTILQNVELALTLSGVSGAERKRRAEEALREVGLGDHMEKHPNQLSGGQMQRVAIARALVNNPDIILADEPTGALDSKTSIQVMEILKKVANNKLVVMVTHNPELAKQYSTRIITVKDGHIIDDTDPFDGQGETERVEKPKHTSLSLGTALSLSFNNLLMKRGRTLLTAIAGSIGIIGIALILAMANGVNQQAANMVGGTTIPSDITVSETYKDDAAASQSLATSAAKNSEIGEHSDTIVATDDLSMSGYVIQREGIKHNDTAALRKYVEGNKGKIDAALEAVTYDYGLPLQVYDKDANGQIIKVNPVVKTDTSEYASLFGGNVTEDVKVESLISSAFKEIISDKVYDVVSGKLPSAENELVLVLNEKNELPLTVMYSLNLEDRTKLEEIVEKLNNGTKPEFENVSYVFDKIVGKTYRVVSSSKKDDTSVLNADEYAKAMELKVVGIAKVKSSSDPSGYMGYTSALAEKMTPESVKARPEAISFYAKTNNDKEKIKEFLNEYNNGVAESQKVYYVDQTEATIKSIKQVVDLLSYVLIGFVAISLVVSSIMIGIITYISVLERTKEIGILRAIGASKRDVVRVFRAETIIEGLVAGVIGIAISALLCVGINMMVSALAHIDGIANLSVIACVILVLVSVALTVFAGASPAKRASRKDPVEALRGE